MLRGELMDRPFGLGDRTKVSVTSIPLRFSRASIRMSFRVSENLRVAQVLVEAMYCSVKSSASDQRPSK